MLSSTWDYGDRQDEFRRWLKQAAKATRLRNALPTVEWNFDKRYLRELAEADVPTIPTVWSEPGEEERAWEEIERLGWDDVVIKPVVDLGALNLVRVPAHHVLAMLGRFECPVMAQPFLPAVAAEGELSLVYVAGELSHCVRKVPARGDFRVQPQYGGTHEVGERSRRRGRDRRPCAGRGPRRTTTSTPGWTCSPTRPGGSR